MSVINQIQCQDSVKNTGVCDCFFDPKNFVGAIFAPLGKVFSESNLSDASILATFMASVIAAKSDRLFPFMNWVGVADNSEDATKQTFGFGTQEIVREGKYVLTAEFRKGGLNLNNVLRSFNGTQSKYGVLFIDASNTLIGTKKIVAGATVLAPIPMDDIYTYPFKMNDGSKTTQYRTMYNFDPVYVNENIAFKKVDTSILLFKELSGLTDLTISSGAAASNTTATVKLLTSCGEDMYDTYADELADNTAFVLTNATTGGVITTTSIAKNDGLKAWVITIPTSSNANYPAASGTYKIAPASPPILDGLGVSAYEGVNSLTVTRPA